MSYQHKKKFGQNFLVDQQVLVTLAKFINPNKNDSIVEIGPGMGALTSQIINQAAQLSLIEIDQDLINELQAKFVKTDEVTLINQDVLKVPFYDLLKSSSNRMKLVGNLPYNISNPIVFKVLEELVLSDLQEKLDSCFFMVQKEVALRIASKPADTNYGCLTVIMQYFFEVVLLLDIKADSFEPMPKVDSSFISLAPKKLVIPVADSLINWYYKFSIVVKTAFAQRRKTLLNNFKKYLAKTDFEALEIDSNLRAQDLDLQDFENLTKIIFYDKK